jgi:hypothetical protein
MRENTETLAGRTVFLDGEPGVVRIDRPTGVVVEAAGDVVFVPRHVVDLRVRVVCFADACSAV